MRMYYISNNIWRYFFPSNFFMLRGDRVYFYTDGVWSPSSWEARQLLKDLETNKYEYKSISKYEMDKLLMLSELSK
jgi:hypothetical protein